MLSFTSDPYHPGETTLTRQTLEVLIERGMGMCTLTKGGTRALRDIDLFRPDRDAFASTLTSLDDSFSKKWEPGAALPGNRIAALKKFQASGIFTWASLEPTLDIESSLAIVRETHSFVDLYKVGRVNYLPMTKTTDWQDYTLRMIDLLQSLGSAHYIKKDLQKYLPAGFHNPMRVRQHHGEAIQHEHIDLYNRTSHVLICWTRIVVVTQRTPAPSFGGESAQRLGFGRLRRAKSLQLEHG